MYEIRALNNTKQELDQAIEIYRLCFSGPPWHEKWTYESAALEINMLLATSFLLAAVAKDQFPSLTTQIAALGAGMAASQSSHAIDSFAGSPVDELEQIFWIDELATHPNHQGQGLCHRLIQKLEEEAKAQKFKQIALRTRTDNEKAIAVFKNSGFSEFAICNAKTGGIESRRIVMLKSLE